MMMATNTVSFPRHHRRQAFWSWLAAATISLFAVIVWQGFTSQGRPALAELHGAGFAGALDIGILVFREGLECILVLAAITAGMTGPQQSQRRYIGQGAIAGFAATLVTWCIAIRILDDIGTKISALHLQAATGLLAIVVLLIVMNWFFHKMYWTGWISLHNRRKRELQENNSGDARRIAFGLGLLGFSSFYREGVEVVLFLQGYRLRLGHAVISLGVLIGLFFTALVGVVTFLAHKKLPYKKMLVLTGVMLGVVLFVMVGEQAQEMQLAGWLSTTRIPWLSTRIPSWMSLWFSIFPTWESLTAQTIAVILVLGSYIVAQKPQSRPARQAS